MNHRDGKKPSLNYAHLKNTSVFLVLSLVTLFIRLPFFFRDYIDRDESTFILLGQSWVDGNLPYSVLWDLKPPLTFAFFALIISIFGKSFIAIRLFGTIVVIVIAFFTYKLSLQVTTKKVSLWAALLCVGLLSLFGSVQGVMSEHICMAFFIPALYLIATKKSPYWFFLIGGLMGICLMTKLNMAYPGLILGLYLCFEFLKSRTRTSLWKALIYLFGILTIIFLTVLPYYLKGESLLWWNSVIRAPLEYIGARRYSIIKLAPAFILIGGLLFFVWKKGIISFKNKTILILVLAIIGVMTSFLKGGRINGHYLIQVYPMLTIILALLVNDYITKYKPKIHKVFILLLLLVPVESYLEYINVIKNKVTQGTFYNGEGFSVPRYIIENNLETKNIFFLGYHIGYWSLDQLPPSKAATHPSNIYRDELYPFYNTSRKNSMEELRYIMEELKPKTIVVRKNRRVFDKKEIEENEYIDAYLKKHYKIEATVENAEILQRL
ncbi:glycosyltransferase family 39 protein [Maribacter sp. MMG018]|uniref:ArnT family glycosyltransferase n=1 Tax=Maribacter sp. MMG018 TaxID=2822688 RepID=UPI001B3719FE|nr:glycosyltransferase family 39 protein [Maribacter sp. MMG018]MBQ4913109.1 glycosyltransferase family 39 protein [Maribacter sp. MMG018]